MMKNKEIQVLLEKHVGKEYMEYVELNFEENELTIIAGNSFYGIEYFIDVIKVIYRFSLLKIKDGRIILKCFN